MKKIFAQEQIKYEKMEKIKQQNLNCSQNYNLRTEKEQTDCCVSEQSVQIECFLTFFCVIVSNINTTTTTCCI